MTRNIGDSYYVSIGHTFEPSRHNPCMVKKPQRTFWARVKEVLEDRGLPATQAHAAKIVGVQQPSISDWNKPGGYPTVENAVALAQKLNVCVEWLFTERGPKNPAPDDEIARQLWEAWPHLNDFTKGKIVGIASASMESPEAAPSLKSDPDQKAC